MPKVLIIVITIVGTSLLVLNVALIACFVRRRHRKRLAKGWLYPVSSTNDVLLLLDNNFREKKVIKMSNQMAKISALRNVFNGFFKTSFSSSF